MLTIATQYIKYRYDTFILFEYKMKTLETIRTPKPIPTPFPLLQKKILRKDSNDRPRAPRAASSSPFFFGVSEFDGRIRAMSSKAIRYRLLHFANRNSQVWNFEDEATRFLDYFLHLYIHIFVHYCFLLFFSLFTKCETVHGEKYFDEQ